MKRRSPFIPPTRPRTAQCGWRIWGKQTRKMGYEDRKTYEYSDAYLPGKEGLVAGGSKHTVRVGPDGVAWSSGSRISRFDPNTGKFTDFNQPAYGVVVDKDGKLLVHGIFRGRKIGRIDGKTLEVKTWNPPGSKHRVFRGESNSIRWHRLVQPVRRGADRPFRSENGNFPKLSLPRPDSQPLCNEPG